jgi:hypothetical protein
MLVLPYNDNLNREGSQVFESLQTVNQIPVLKSGHLHQKDVSTNTGLHRAYL